MYQNAQVLRSSISSSSLARHKPESRSDGVVQGSPGMHYTTNSNSSTNSDSNSIGWPTHAESSTTGDRSGVEAAAIRPSVSSSSWLLAVTGVAVIFVQDAPGWLLATYYLVAASVALLLAVGMLLWSQLSYMSWGVTYIQHLKRQSGGSSPGQDYQQQKQQQQQGSGDGGFSRWTQQPGAIVSGRFELLWVRVCEVLGADCSDHWWCLLKVLFIPRWHDPVVRGGAAAAKKWS